MVIEERSSGLRKRRSYRAEWHAVPVETEDGVFTVGYSEAGLTKLDFPGTRGGPAKPVRLPAPLADWHLVTQEALTMVLRGLNPAELPPMDLACGTIFQRRVWATLSQIRAGEVVTYARLAERAGHPRAVRAVAGACGANPIPVLIPCHRIVASGGGLGGFSGGLRWKRLLLARETDSVFG